MEKLVLYLQSHNLFQYITNRSAFLEQSSSSIFVRFSSFFYWPLARHKWVQYRHQLMWSVDPDVCPLRFNFFWYFQLHIFYTRIKCSTVSNFKQLHLPVACLGGQSVPGKKIFFFFFFFGFRQSGHSLVHCCHLGTIVKLPFCPGPRPELSSDRNIFVWW